MSTVESVAATLAHVRRLESSRIKATRENDVETLAELLDDELLYIKVDGELFSKSEYLREMKSHGLTYEADFDFRETDHRVSDGIVIFIGSMRGHARLLGEQRVFNLRGMSVWRSKGDRWSLLAWQTSSQWRDG